MSILSQPTDSNRFYIENFHIIVNIFFSVTILEENKLDHHQDLLCLNNI